MSIILVGFTQPENPVARLKEKPQGLVLWKSDEIPKSRRNEHLAVSCVLAYKFIGSVQLGDLYRLFGGRVVEVQTLNGLERALSVRVDPNFAQLIVKSLTPVAPFTVTNALALKILDQSSRLPHKY